MIDQSRIGEVLGLMGLEDSQTNRRQLGVMNEALLIFQERERSRGGLWMQTGYPDSALHIKSKALRLNQAVAMGAAEGEEAIDEALDVINYAAFYVRNARASRDGEEHSHD
jgi:hypothetical protein